MREVKISQELLLWLYSEMLIFSTYIAEQGMMLKVGAPFNFCAVFFGKLELLSILLQLLGHYLAARVQVYVKIVNIGNKAPCCICSHGIRASDFFFYALGSMH